MRCAIRIFSLAMAVLLPATGVSAETFKPSEQQVELIMETLSTRAPKDSLTFTNLLATATPLEGGGEHISACGNVLSSDGTGVFADATLFFGSFLSVPEGIIEGVPASDSFIIIGLEGEGGVTEAMVENRCEDLMGIEF